MENVINYSIVILSLLSLLSSFFPEWGLWGLDHFRFFPLSLRISLIIAVILFSVPQISLSIAEALGKRVMSLSRKTAQKLAAAVIIILGISFIVFASENHVLGDGYNILGNISGGLIFSPAEPLAYVVHHYLTVALGHGETAAALAYKVTSVLSGLGFLLGLYFFTVKEYDFPLMVAIAFCFAPMQFFYGYIENYTFSFIFSSFYLLSGLRDIERKRLSIATSFWLLLALLAHFSSGVLLPSFIYLIYSAGKSRKMAIYYLIVSIFVSLAAGIIVLTHFDLMNIFVPIVPNSTRSYSLLSAVHIKDMLNTMLLSAPLITVCPLLFKILRGKKWKFLSLAMSFSLLFTFVVDPTLGAYRDWDLLARFSFPVMVFYFSLINCLSSIDKKKMYSSLIPLILFAIVHTGSWIMLNSSKEEGYVYAKSLVNSDPHYSLGYQNGFRNKSWGYFAKNRINDIPEAIRAWEIRYRGEPGDYLNVQSLIRAYGAIGDTASAVSLIRKEWERFVTEDTTMSQMASFLVKAGEYRDAERIYERLLKVKAADYRIYNDLAIVMMRLGKVDSSAILFDQSFRHWPNPPLDQELKFYIACHQSGYHTLTSEGFNRIKSRLRPELQTRIDELLKSLNKGDTTSVKMLLQSILAGR